MENPKVPHIFIETNDGSIEWVANSLFNVKVMGVLATTHLQYRQIWIEELDYIPGNSESDGYSDWWDLSP